MAEFRVKIFSSRTDIDSQPYDRRLSHVDLIFHFHKYFDPVAKKYLFEVKQILLTDLFVSHLAPFEFDMVTPFRVVLIKRETKAAVACIR